MHYLDRPTEVRQQFEVCIVTGVRRDGTVRAVRDSWGHVRDVRTDETIHILGRNDVDVDAAYAACRSHAYPGHPGQPMPFDSLDECRAMIRPYLSVAGPGRGSGVARTKIAIPAYGPAEHEHVYCGERKVHTHAGGELPHSFYGHPEDPAVPHPDTLLPAPGTLRARRAGGVR